MLFVPQLLFDRSMCFLLLEVLEGSDNKAFSLFVTVTGRVEYLWLFRTDSVVEWVCL